MASILDFAEDSSDSENDADYVPSDEEASELSLEENTDEEADPSAEISSKVRKRRKGKKSNVRVSNDDNAAEAIVEKTPLNEEDEKKRAENLWQDFLQDVTPPVRKKTADTESTANNQVPTAKLCDKNDQSAKKVTVSEIFEFAGETVVVSKEVDQNSEEVQKDRGKTTLSHASICDEKKSPAKDIPKESHSSGVKRSSGLGSVLGTIMNKKQKLSTLQKSMLDWKSFKKDKGIEEELDQHRRSKDSFVEKQAFLQRADVRQFEIERDIRLSSRSNR